MTTNDDHISESQCSDWRLGYRDGQSAYRMATRHDVNRQLVLTHLRGECEHPDTEPPISRTSSHNISTPECRDIREAYATESSIEEIQESTGRRWKTLVRHLTGACTHERPVDAPVVDKEDILARDSISAAECAQFRRGVKEAGDVMSYADGTDFQYQAILAHVNGECSHEVDVPPRARNERSRDISRARCQEIRQEYRSGPDTDVDSIAEEYDCSPVTIERHVMFRCSHDPQDALVTDVEAVRDILPQGLQARRKSGSDDPFHLDTFDDNGGI